MKKIPNSNAITISLEHLLFSRPKLLVRFKTSFWWLSNSEQKLGIPFGNCFQQFPIKCWGTGFILYISMTSLLAHTVAQPTKWRCLPKNLNQLVIFVIELEFTWSWVHKNHQNLIFYVKNQFYNFNSCFC